MKTKITYIAFFTFLMVFSGVFAQNAEGESNNPNYQAQRSSDLQNANQNTLVSENDNQANAATRAAAAQLINYQAVARDAGGNLLINAAVAIDFIIHEGSAGGASVFTETQNLMTDANGVFSAQIGSVTPLTVPWSSDAYFLEVMLNGTSVGTTEFVSVPYAKSADTMPTDARIGDSSVSSADVVTITGDNTAVGEIIDVRASNVVTAANDLMNMDMPSGSSTDAQFIEARNGGAVQFQVQGDGRTLINATTTAPQLNTVYGNSMPIAYASITSGGTISVGYGVTSVANPATGVYDIVLDHNTSAANTVVMITPFTGSIGVPEICGYNPTGANTFSINCQSTAGAGVNTALSFVVYGDH